MYTRVRMGATAFLRADLGRNPHGERPPFGGLSDHSFDSFSASLWIGLNV